MNSVCVCTAKLVMRVGSMLSDPGHAGLRSRGLNSGPGVLAVIFGMLHSMMAYTLMLGGGM